MNCAPICFFPTTVVMVDDHTGYLNSLIASANWDKTAYLFYSNPLESYDFLEKTAKVNFFLPEYFTNPTIAQQEKDISNVNLNTILEFVYNPKRFSQPSLLLLDQEMPSLSGLEICRRLKDSSMRKILITGEAEIKGVDVAFNEGLIHKLITKGDRDFAKILNETISEQQDIFMKQLTSPVKNAIMQFDKKNTSLLCNQDFIELHEKIIKQNNICEYYLFGINGSYVFFDVTANPSWLVVKNSDEIESDYNLGKNSDSPPSEEILKKLKEGELILHLLTDEEKQIKPSAWEQASLIYPASILKGEGQIYYYAYIDNPNAHNIHSDKILSFRSYIESIA